MRDLLNTAIQPHLRPFDSLYSDGVSISNPLAREVHFV